MDALNLKSFLRFGCYLRYDPEFRVDFSQISSSQFSSLDDGELLEVYATTFRRAMERAFTPNRDHLLPLSGGFDSRALLGFLLELTPARNIHTCTFGSPGTSDYEIGNRLAAKVGTDHTTYPLSATSYAIDDLLALSAHTRHQTRLFEVPPILEICRDFAGCLSWSGFAGEILAGDSLPRALHDSEEAARKDFIRIHTHVETANLTGSDGSELDELLRLPEPLPPEQLSFYEQISFETEQAKLIAPHMLFTGLEHTCPFTDPELAGFMLSLPRRMRLGKSLYRKFLATSLPELFALPSKSNDDLPLAAGRVRVLTKKAFRRFARAANTFYPLFSDRWINYLDFDRAVRTSPTFEKLLYENLMDLKERQLLDGLDLDRLWSDVS